MWSDYTSQAEVAQASGIRLDTNYYYWPDTWVNDRPGLFTGSGFPMRFARADGSFIDVYQAATQMTDESGQTFPFTIDTLLDRALGPLGYYGTFVANIHTDTAVDTRANAIVASAQARGVPVISARQLLNWVDARNASRFDAISWDGYRLGFTVSAAAAARGLQAMLPATASPGPLTGIRRNGAALAFTVASVKGVAYAVFEAASGTYEAEYAIDTFAPVVSGQSASPGQTDAIVSWTTNESANSRVAFGLSASALNLIGERGGQRACPSGHVDRPLQRDHVLLPCYLDRWRRIGRRRPHPELHDGDHSDSGSGVGHDGRRVRGRHGAHWGIHHVPCERGTDSARSTVGTDFDGGALPSGWSFEPWHAAGSAVVAGGRLSVDGARANTDDLFTPGRALEFVATFGSEGSQHAGLALTFNESRWAMFSTGSSGVFMARTHTGAAAIDTPIQGAWQNAPHRFRIEWGTSSVVFYIDGTLVATHQAVISDPMRPVISDFTVTGQPLTVDSLEMTPPYVSSASFVSRVFDAGLPVRWTSAAWTAALPSGSSLVLAVRFGERAVPDGSWTAFAPVPTSGAPLAQTSRFVQYRAELASDGTSRPSLEDVTIAAGRVAPTVSVADAAVAEGQIGTSILTFSVTIPYASTSEVRVNYATTPGTATGADFTAVSGTAVIAAGTTSTTVAVAVPETASSKTTKPLRCTSRHRAAARLAMRRASAQS